MLGFGKEFQCHLCLSSVSYCCCLRPLIPSRMHAIIMLSRNPPCERKQNDIFYSKLTHPNVTAPELLTHTYFVEFPGHQRLRLFFSRRALNTPR